MFFSSRKSLGKHLLSTLNSKASRATDVEAGKCPLLPSGSFSQLVCQLLNLVEGYPYLLLWSYQLQLEGMSVVMVRGILSSLGLVPEFRWTEH